MLLRADTPQEWLCTHLEAHAAARDEEPAAEPGTWSTLDAPLADDARSLRDLHERLARDGSASPAAAAKWVTSWIAGPVAEAVAFVLATAFAGVLVTGGIPVRRNAGGWVERVRLDGFPVLVAPGHPWEGQPGVLRASDRVELRDRTVAALATAVGPIVEVGSTLAKVGRRSLWVEIADAAGATLAFDSRLPVDAIALAALDAALAAPSAPWGRRPRLGIRESAAGPIYLMQRAGCCLAYQGQDDAASPAPEELSPDLRAYLAAFPIRAGEPRYCSTCSLRDPADCDARREFWVTSERRTRAARGDE
jgi:hypothetical protein